MTYRGHKYSSIYVLLASWYAKGIINRPTFIYHWARAQERGLKA